MAYQYIPDHLKKKAGRPRKYEAEPRPKKRYIPKELNVQQTAEKLRGVPIVQLDYETGEYITEYPSMAAIALDYDIPQATVTGVFQKDSCCIVRLPKYQLLMMKKTIYDTIVGGVS